VTTKNTALSEAGRRGGRAAAESARALAAAAAASDAEVRRLQHQKTALIAFAKGKGATNDEIMDLLSTSLGEAK